MFTESLIGTKAKVKILRVLAEARTAYSLKSLRDETGLSLSIAHKAAEELAEEGILARVKGTRKERLYRFNADSPFAASIFELFRTEKTRQRKEVILMRTWSVLEWVVSKIKNKSQLIVLFGSQARGDATLVSDIDLIVIPKNPKEDIPGLIRKTKAKINPVVMSMAAFSEEVKNNTLFYRNVKKDGVILHINPEAKKQLAKFMEDANHKG